MSAEPHQLNRSTGAWELATGNSEDAMGVDVDMDDSWAVADGNEAFPPGMPGQEEALALGHSSSKKGRSVWHSSFSCFADAAESMAAKSLLLPRKESGCCCGCLSVFGSELTVPCCCCPRSLSRAPSCG